MSKPNVLVVEDEQLMRSILRQLLENVGYRVFTADSAENALEIFAQEEVIVTLTDIKMAGMDGLELLDQIKTIDDEALVIIMTAYSSVDSAIAALRKGAYDYVTKPFVNEDLLQTVRNAILTKELFKENRNLRRELDKHYSFSEIIGTSEALQKVFRVVEKVADTTASVLIEGESGVGKELAARAVHELSERADGPFEVVDCGSIPTELIESELFGHVRGSFTGAHRDRRGAFELAHRGTLFLDEIGEMPLQLQTRLLRVLQESRFRRVGDEHLIEVDVRVVAATNRELRAEVAAKRFREDLFYRLNVFSVRMPPLRERPDDLVPLVTHFLKRQGRELGVSEWEMSREALEALEHYDWPGNIRELSNICAGLCVRARRDGQIDLEDLEQVWKRQHGGERPPWEAQASVPADGLGTWVIEQARAARFNLIEAARALQKRKRHGERVPIAERSARECLSEIRPIINIGLVKYRSCMLKTSKKN